MRALIAERTLAGGIVSVYYDPEAGVSGRYWVSAKNRSGKSLVQEKIFSDEKAWSDAERFANDVMHSLGGDYTQTIAL
ncbi:hypothetical protein UFOVP1264_65 [uncultured Caudovirales phage]|uniref:Uncharacterized protein n=1 Tax=uncultured Caudovirales phage TaxID=2100421 RepID=A0A6J5RAN6_9CAUD|nr:hypothetical protein UFOVP1264_65 [uncultured Caudovirales phage]